MQNATNAKMPNAKMPKKEKFSKMLQFTCFIEGNFSKFGMCKMFDKYDVCPQFFYGKRNILLKSIAVITGYSLIVIKDMWIIWCWQFRLKLWEVNFIFQTDNYWSWPDFPFFRYVNKIGSVQTLAEMIIHRGQRGKLNRSCARTVKNICC